VTLESASGYWRPFYYLLEARGLNVRLVNARDVKNAPGRPRTGKLDSVWQARCTERGMLRPSVVPPAEIRRLRDCTRLRAGLTRERTRHFSRLEKLLEDALIKVSSVASTLDTASVRDMLEAPIAGQRNPQVLAGLARGRPAGQLDRAGSRVLPEPQRLLQAAAGRQLGGAGDAVGVAEQLEMLITG
jgi:transposase